MCLLDLAISGRDLIEMGYVPGPAFGKTMNTLLEMVLEDSELNTKEALVPLAKEIMESNT